MCGCVMVLRRIDKEYFPLEEVVAEWQLPKFDLLYLVETGGLRLSIRITRLSVEQGDIEDVEQGISVRVPARHGKYTGIVDLFESDARTILVKGKTTVSWFMVPQPGYMTVNADDGSIEVDKSELLLTKQEKNRFEGTIEKAPTVQLTADDIPRAPFAFSKDYKQVSIGTSKFRLGERQASVIRQLRQAAIAGDPWCLGKTLLANSGSTSLRMNDLFKSQTGWRQLIASDGRGRYRLNTEIVPG